MTRNTKKQAVAVPYEPTEREQKALASYHTRKAAARPAPSFKIKMTGERTAETKIDHADPATGFALLMEAIGTSDPDFTTGLLSDIGKPTATKAGECDEAKFNYALSIVRGIEPRDQLEAMLGSQMAAVQIAAMDMAGRMAVTSDVKKQECFERSFTRLSRTFTAQIEALKRYRSKGEQRVYVERVNVEQGGQAIVGNVETGDRGRG